MQYHLSCVSSSFECHGVGVTLSPRLVLHRGKVASFGVVLCKCYHFGCRRCQCWFVLNHNIVTVASGVSRLICLLFGQRVSQLDILSQA